MPRILVADDNSNIQKMVTLALKDVGIDVVAVPNGEAAVRKLTDSNLDLVLADIFMPVRSGYEVCEFIKQDPRYSHLPVVLLVGAFDPLDEREAQRVGADGILKKPFVPPDPLINMVKGLLAKAASERLVAISASAESAGASTAEAAPPPLPKRAPEPPREFPTADFSDVAPEEFVPPVGRLEFEETEHPIAFDSLLDATTADDRDLTVTASRDPVLGEPAFWAHPTTDEAGIQLEETDDGDVLQDHNWGAHAQPLPFGIETPTSPLPTRETESQASTFNIAAEAESEALPALDLAAHPAKNLDLPSETVSDASPSLIIEAITESGNSGVLPSDHFPPIEPEGEPANEANAESKSENELGIAHTLNLATEPAIEAMQAVELATEHANLLDVPSAAAADFGAAAHETAAAPTNPGVEHFFPDLAAISAELEAMSTVKLASASQKSPEAQEPAYLSDAADEAKHAASVFETPTIEEPKPVEAAPVQPTNEATIDTQKVDVDSISSDTLNAEVSSNSAASDDKPSAANAVTNGDAYLDQVPSLAEMPGWMASVSSMFPPMESSLESAAKAELEALSREHGAIPQATLGEQADPSSHTEQLEHEEPAAHATSEAASESAELSEPNLLTTAWPPPFEPKVSDAELFERPTLSSRIFEIPLEAADTARASAPHVSESAPAVTAPASLSAVPQTGNGTLQTPEMLEAIVSRIVERMQPQVIDIVTREILRPLVEALVRREIDKH